MHVATARVGNNAGRPGGELSVPYDISVAPEGDGTYRVVVTVEGATTTYAVTVPSGLAEQLGWSAATEAELVRRSFAFLLERESPSAILRRFSLEVIGRYFPDYPAALSRPG